MAAFGASDPCRCPNRRISSAGGCGLREVAMDTSVKPSAEPTSIRPASNKAMPVRMVPSPAPVSRASALACGSATEPATDAVAGSASTRHQLGFQALSRLGRSQLLSQTQHRRTGQTALLQGQIEALATRRVRKRRSGVRPRPRRASVGFRPGTRVPVAGGGGPAPPRVPWQVRGTSLHCQLPGPCRVYRCAPIQSRNCLQGQARLSAGLRPGSTWILLAASRRVTRMPISAAGRELRVPRPVPKHALGRDFAAPIIHLGGVKVKRRDRAYYQGVVFENPNVQKTAAYGFTPDTLQLHPDRRQAMGLRYGLEHIEQ